MNLFRQFDEFFLNWPTEQKPPIVSRPIFEKKEPVYATGGGPDPVSFKRGKMLGWNIQMALAGFSEKDIEVWHENQILHIKGSNLQKEDIAPKFHCEFHHKISCANELDLPRTSVSLENGILNIDIKIIDEIKNRKYLFGRSDKNVLKDPSPG